MIQHSDTVSLHGIISAHTAGPQGTQGTKHSVEYHSMPTVKQDQGLGGEVCQAALRREPGSKFTCVC